ncbi:DNA (cytosine-5)-methyltransferase 1 [Variovorax boronicumulans]|uniref:DNA cytosine methyltransferase n=1 Tax=Variovorax boronicumulans TaxID=436515 RepID=UPI0027893C0C|nr:DNA cytosine methyltransferase [Variovorax boronicumulans]MDP9916733.1 DNA (cytosine-5)-methyltransferase 1 [Variovorax boronicumulans]
MKVAGLFAGIGGFELGLAESGHAAELLCDILPTSQAVLKHRFPGAELVSDIVDMNALSSDIEIVTAGFPCQDLSQAGNTAGLAGHRSGLIGEVFRLLEKRKKARRPVPWVVVENVPFMLQLGGGDAMRAIIDEFERLKYRWAYRVVDTNGFGLPQRRERVYLVATTEGNPEDVLLSDDNPLARPVTDLKKFAHGFYWTEGRGGLGWAVDAIPTLKNGSTIGIASPPAVLMRSGAIVKPGIRAAEALQGFDADWTQAAETVAKPSMRWALVGNAVSVPVPRWIGRQLNNPGSYDKSRDAAFPETGRAPRAARFDGKKRYMVDIGPDPLGLRSDSLEALIGRDYTLLSRRATSGFLERTRRATLRFAPGFIEAVEKHLDVVTGLEDKAPAANLRKAA